MDVALFIKDGDAYRQLSVPLYVVRDLLRDRLSKCEIDRIRRLSSSAQLPNKLSSGSVVVDFSNRDARCFQANLGMEDLEPTWNVHVEKTTLKNY